MKSCIFHLVLLRFVTLQYTVKPLGGSVPQYKAAAS